MKRFFVMAVALIVSATAVSAQDQSFEDWAQFGRYAEANKTAERHAAAVLYGDSITDIWFRDHAEFFREHHFVGRGISGQTTSEMLVRFRADVINLRPERVIILAGTNDIARNNGRISLEHILDNLISMCELAEENDIEPVLCSVLPCSIYPWRKDVSDPVGTVRKLNRMIKAYAEKEDIDYIDYYSAMADEKGGLKKEMARDAVHPNLEGYAVMEKILSDYML